MLFRGKEFGMLLGLNSLKRIPIDWMLVDVHEGDCSDMHTCTHARMSPVWKTGCPELPLNCANKNWESLYLEPLRPEPKYISFLYKVALPQYVIIVIWNLSTWYSSKNSLILFFFFVNHFCWTRTFKVGTWHDFSFKWSLITSLMITI